MFGAGLPAPRIGFPTLLLGWRLTPARAESITLTPACCPRQGCRQAPSSWGRPFAAPVAGGSPSMEAWKVGAPAPRPLRPMGKVALFP